MNISSSTISLLSSLPPGADTSIIGADSSAPIKSFIMRLDVVAIQASNSGIMLRRCITFSSYGKPDIAHGGYLVHR